MSFQIVGKKMLFYILIDKYKVEKVNKKNKFLVNCENQKPIWVWHCHLSISKRRGFTSVVSGKDIPMLDNFNT